MSGKYAICVYYLIDQNEPSKPDSELVWIPDDPVERDKLLRELWSESCCGNDEGDEGDVEISVNDDPNDYGDVQIGDGSSYMYFTFIKTEIVPCTQTVLSKILLALEAGMVVEEIKETWGEETAQWFVDRVKEQST